MRSVTLHASAVSARSARGFVRAFCRDSALSAAVGEDVELLVSELVSNAYVHARSDAELRIWTTAHVLRVEVSDGSPRPPRVLAVEEDETGGRGVLILDAVATRWGVLPAEVPAQGKTVWFELDLPQAAQAG